MKIGVQAQPSDSLAPFLLTISKTETLTII